VGTDKSNDFDHFANLIGFSPVWNYLARWFQTGPKPIWQSGQSHSTYPFPQDHKVRQFELCPPQILPEAGTEGQHQPWERTEARMVVRLLGRTMLGQTVVAAIIHGFVGTDKSNDFDHFAK